MSLEWGLVDGAWLRIFDSCGRLMPYFSARILADSLLFADAAGNRELEAATSDDRSCSLVVASQVLWNLHDSLDDRQNATRLY